MLVRGVHSLVLLALLSHGVAGCPAHPSRKHQTSSQVSHNTLNNGSPMRSATVSRALDATLSTSSPSQASSGTAAAYQSIPEREASFSKAADAGSASFPTSISLSNVGSASKPRSIQVSSSFTTKFPAQVSASGHASSVTSAASSVQALTSSKALPSASGRPLTPDNTCGGPNGYTCNPNDSLGGACCSASGFCGNTDAYCGTGCQIGFGTCSSSTGGNVPGLGYFSNFKTYTFESGISTELQRSGYPVFDTVGNPNAIYNHSYAPENVAIEDGYLVLTVPGGQTTSPILCAEVQTVATNIKYASVRTKAILTSEPGVVDGFFFYHDDCQEIDIEYLPDASSLSNPQGQAIPLQYTNQALSCVPGTGTHTTRPAPADAQSAEHEYRYDWVPGRVDYYTDGVLQDTFTTNIPTEPGAVLWNIWSNGDPGFTVGPPARNAVLRIKEINMYYNTTS